MIRRWPSIHQASLGAIVELSTLLHDVGLTCPDPDYQKIKGGIGLSIGTIQTELMDLLYVDHPKLDDLAVAKLHLVIGDTRG